MIIDHKKIAQRYFFSGFMIYDLVATFPVDKLMRERGSDPLKLNEGSNQTIPKLFRLTRFGRVYMLLD